MNLCLYYYGGFVDLKDVLRFLHRQDNLQINKSVPDEPLR